MSSDPGQKYDGHGTNFASTLHHDIYPAIDPTKANLKDKYIFITGASKGIGKAAAISFAQAGASGIALGARSPLTAIIEETKLAAKQAGHPEPKILALTLDVTSRESVDSAAHEISAAFEHRIDVLVNNAGYQADYKPLVNTDPDEWWYEHAVNIKGPYLITRAFLPLLLNSPLKVLLNISSVAAHSIGFCSSSYSVSKLGLCRFTEIVDHEHGPRTGDGVVAISVHPGGVRTELGLRLPGEYHGFLVDSPELAGGGLVWLAGERREWLAGRYVSLNWDVEELEGRKESIVEGDLLRARLAVNSFGGV